MAQRAFTQVVIHELDRGIDPSVLTDIGYGPIAEGLELGVPIALEENEAELAAIEERFNADMQAIKVRGKAMEDTVAHATALRSLEGEHLKKPNRFREGTEKAYLLQRERRLTREALSKACGSCLVADTCNIDGNLERWLNLHPNATGRTHRGRNPALDPRKTEPRDKLMKRLKRDPLASCVPGTIK